MADRGVTQAFVSPGSRNTPLVLAAIAEPRIETTSVRDERSAAFMAVGWAKGAGLPAIVMCTSGSAAAHYFPGIVEADQSGTPLVVMTSDRPIRLRGTGAPQTMDQTELYGSHVVRSIDGETIDEPRTSGRSIVDLTCGSVAAAPGAVHVNLPFDEPLVPTVEHRAPAAEPSDRPPDRYHPVGTFERLAGQRVLIVASGRQEPGFAAAIDRFAQSVGAPIVADPQTPVSGPNALGHPDLLVSAHDDDGRRFVLDALAPDVVVRLGPLPTSKPLWEWLERSGVPQIHVERSRLGDPLGSADVSVVADPLAVLEAEPAPSNPNDYAARWLSIDSVAGSALDAALAALPFPNEPAVARTVADLSPAASALFLASSRPIRDVDAFATHRGGRDVLANRGVNGIDGMISTAAGFAMATGPVTALLGDVAFLHDATSVAEVARLGLPLRIVAVNNDGGGIFEFLPQARSDVLDRVDFEHLWATPHGLSLREIARSLGMPARQIDDHGEFVASISSPIDGPELIEVVTDRSQLLDHHGAIRLAISEALRGSDELQ